MLNTEEVAAKLPDHPVSGTATRGWSRGRLRRAGLSAIASFAAKLITVATALISVPLTLHYLGPERYGIWLTLSTFSSLLSFSDFGVGSGVLHAVAAACGTDDRRAIARVASSGLAVLSLLGLAGLLILVCVFPFVSWANIFNVTGDLARREAGQAVFIFLASIFLAFPIETVERVQIGMQLPFVPTIWRALGSVATLLSLLIVIKLKLGLPWLVGAFCFTPLVVTTINAFTFFGLISRDVSPSLSQMDLKNALRILKDGSNFFAQNALANLTKYADNIIIAQVLGAAMVPSYAVPEKLFAQISGTLTMCLAPFWPAFREALIRGDHTWVRDIFRKILTVAVLYSSLLALALVMSGNEIIKFWVGATVKPSLALLTGLGVWKVVEAISFVMATYLNASGNLRVQFWSWVAASVVSLLLSVVLARWIGVAGVVWGTVVAFSVCCLVPWIVVTFRSLERLT